MSEHISELKTSSKQASKILKQPRAKCESPIALWRRRALEQDKRNSDIRLSNITSVSASPVSFNKILEGVVAYIEIKSKQQDRSSGVKALVRSMGAAVEDHFSKEVTHVIFKDASFTTYQKANLMKVHLVSVLWVEACRKSGTKISEKKFPALGTDAFDISALCSVS
ncbi:hypothetical protein JTB14_038399 [Gonioctena quinquepunctata]|nr:hypothetical protein JTB14_038399 [Gonioctena quinquepunctata]